MPKHFLALDLGAESGRAVLGAYDGSTLSMEELHRFPNEPVRVGGDLHWDMLRLWHEIRRGITAASSAVEGLEGIGVDTWGVDFALLDANGRLLQNPYHYRDTRTDGVQTEMFARIPQAEIYAETGIQFMQLNSLVQLCAAARQTPEILRIARHFLTIPDLLNYWLTGAMKTEFTIATTTQMYNPMTRDWARDLLRRFELPTDIFQDVVQPGTMLGSLKPELLGNLRFGSVIAPATHDTGSAVAAIALRADTLYISSGTWSLMGAEVPEPIITPEAQRLNFTNEGGVGGTIRLLKNIMGMWLLQGCRRRWLAEGNRFDYGTLVGMTNQEPVLRSVIEPDNPLFLHPEDMTAAICEFCGRTGQPVPETPADYVQIILESLALKYRLVKESIEQLTGRKYTEIRIVGGGARNRVLNQFTADAAGCRVVAGPIEATALGNLAMQMVGTGAMSSVAEARAMIERSFPTESFEPRPSSRWDEAFLRMQQMQSA